jgi:DNA-binding transcriptional ArsR family regulator
MEQHKDLYNDLAELFKIMGDPTRIKILFCLSKKEMCVIDIAELIGMTHSAVSHQLANLKSARMVKSVKKGKEVYYSLDDSHIERLFDLAIEHIKEVR